MTVYSTSRYSSEDFESASIRSAAPSYTSDAPSYHSTLPHTEAVPAYSPRTTNRSQEAAATHNSNATSRRQTIGLPPVPSGPPQSMTSIHNYTLPTWSMANVPAARQYRNVAERRISDARKKQTAEPMRQYHGLSKPRGMENVAAIPEARPLEDPYLVGEEAAAQARSQRIARETGDDILQREDERWDWLLAQMKTWEERERSWARFRRDASFGHRNKLLSRVCGRLMN